MTIKKLDDFEVGYRKGVVFTLNNLTQMFGEKKIREDKLSIPLKIYFKALLDKLDYFIDYGNTVQFAYSNHDKKGIPTKAEVFKSYAHYKRTKKLNLLLEVLQMEKELNNEQTF